MLLTLMTLYYCRFKEATAGREDQNRTSNVSGKEPVAILGYHMEMASKELSKDEFMALLKDKKTMVSDLLESGNLAPSQLDQGDRNPWKVYSKMANRSLYRQCDEIDADTDLFRLSEKEIKFMNFRMVQALELAWRGLEMAGVPLHELHRTRTGVIVAGYNILGSFKSYPDDTTLRGGLMSSLADQVSYFLGTHGPSVSLETACSSSLVALSVAIDAIRNGSCDVAIVIAINRHTQEYELALQVCMALMFFQKNSESGLKLLDSTLMQAAGVLSPEGKCKPFDDSASGTVRCEGAGCIVLSSKQWARNNDHQVMSLLVNAVMGSAGADPQCVEGSGRIYEAPNKHGISEMIRLCHKQIDLPLESVKYLEAHATGTAVGDLIELEAVRDVYKDSHSQNHLKIGSVKGNIGHAELAAGLFSVIKVIEMLREKKFLPSGGCDTPRSDFDWNEANIQVCREIEEFPKDTKVHIGVNSFGVGGSYGHAILTNEDEDSTSGVLDKGEALHGVLLPLQMSAATSAHLDAFENSILEFIRKHPDTNLLDICGSISVNRPRMPTVRNYLVGSVDDLTMVLESDDKPTPCESRSGSKAVFIFTGQGAQWPRMGSKLLQFKAYRDAVQSVDAEFHRISGWSILKNLMELTAEELSRTKYAQPATFMVQIGLVELLKYFGIEPTAVLGHSAGEIPALYCAGHISLSTAVEIVFVRSQAQETVSGCGRMLAISGLGKDEVIRILNQLRSVVPNCEVACINSPRSVVVGGPESELKLVVENLQENCRWSLLRGDIAFHTSKMNGILKDMEKKLSRMNGAHAIGNFSSETVPFISTVTGYVMNRPLSIDYFVQNVRQPVQFVEAIKTMEDGSFGDIVIEIGPHKTLGPSIIESLNENSKIKVLSTLRRNGDDKTEFLELLMGMMNANIQLDLKRFYKDMGYSYSDLMRYLLPCHPIIRKNFHQYLRGKIEGECSFNYNVGPAAGTLVSHPPLIQTLVEISSATSSTMADHVMGGEAILPGMYFVEAALESVMQGNHSQGAILSNVSFDSVCHIPDRSKGGETLHLMVKASCNNNSDFDKFDVVSRRLTAVEDSELTVHCTGSIKAHNFLNSFGSVVGEGFYFNEERDMIGYKIEDIGSEGECSFWSKFYDLAVSIVSESEEEN